MGLGNGERDNALKQGRLVEKTRKAFGPTRVYLSGPMSRHPNFNFDAFREAAEWLRPQGYSVFNPAEQGYGDGDPKTGTVSDGDYQKFMREDIAAITRSDMIVMLEGWEQSKGARFELDVARKLGLKVRYLKYLDLNYYLCSKDWNIPEDKQDDSVLQEADRLVSSDRGAAYGHPYTDFSKVTNMAKALWGRGPETPEEHALYMILLKLARLEATPGHHDSIVDIAGYAKTYAMVMDKKVERLTTKS